LPVVNWQLAVMNGQLLGVSYYALPMRNAHPEAHPCSC
jgi:hypothetical protein